MKTFFKPTWGKLILTLLLPTFWVIVGIVHCLCPEGDLQCSCPPPYTFGARPLVWAVFLYRKHWRNFDDSFPAIASVLLGLITAYILSCVIVAIVKKLKK